MLSQTSSQDIEQRIDEWLDKNGIFMDDPALRVGKIRRACTETKLKLTMNSPLMLRRKEKSGF